MHATMRNGHATIVTHVMAAFVLLSKGKKKFLYKVRQKLCTLEILLYMLSGPLIMYIPTAHNFCLIPHLKNGFMATHLKHLVIYQSNMEVKTPV